MDLESWENMTANTTAVNHTCCPDDSGQFHAIEKVFFSKSTSAIAFIWSASLLVAVTSGFLNSLLLWGLARVDHTLKAKVFIFNLSLANIGAPIIVLMNPFTMPALFGQPKIALKVCWMSVITTIGPILVFVQAFSALCLACDRVYAVAKPFHYKVQPYSKVVRVILYAFPWVVALFLRIGLLISTAGSVPSVERGPPQLCTAMLQASSKLQGMNFTDIFLVVTNVISFVMYITLFGLLKYMQTAVTKISATPLRSSSLSLAVTYFLSNITTLLLYIPAPLYSALTGSIRTMLTSPDDARIMMTGLLVLCQCNTCLDPLLLLSRVRAIRCNLPIIHKTKPKVKSKSSSGVMSTTAG